MHIPWKSPLRRWWILLDALLLENMLVHKATYKDLVITNFQGKVEISIDTLSI